MDTCCDKCIHLKAQIALGIENKKCKDYRNEMLMINMHARHLAPKVECTNFESTADASASDYISSKGW